MTFRRTADTFEAGAHTLFREYYTDTAILEKEYRQMQNFLFIAFFRKCVQVKKHNTKDAIDSWNLTNKQDWHISELSQLGVRSRKYFPSPYSGQESLLSAFDEYYLSGLKASS